MWIFNKLFELEEGGFVINLIYGYTYLNHLNKLCTWDWEEKLLDMNEVQRVHIRNKK